MILEGMTKVEKLNAILDYVEENFESIKISNTRTQCLLEGTDSLKSNVPSSIIINNMKFYLYDGFKVRFDLADIEIYVMGVELSRIRLNDVDKFDCCI